MRALFLLPLVLLTIAVCSTRVYAVDPATDDDVLPRLPEVIPNGRIAIQAVSPGGQVMRIDQLSRVDVVLMDHSHWLMESDPKIFQPCAEGWVLIDAKLFKHQGAEDEITFVTQGATMIATREGKRTEKRLTFTTIGEVNEVAIDLSNGPAAKEKEIAGVVVDPEGKPVAGAVVDLPSVFPGLNPFSVRTGDDGVFRYTPRWPGGQDCLRVQKDGYGTRLLTDLPPGRGFTVHLRNDTRFKGQLIGTDGAPAANAELRFETAKPSAKRDLCLRFLACFLFSMPMRTGDTMCRRSQANMR